MLLRINNAEPVKSRAESYNRWEKVKKWVSESKELQDLKGSVLDHVKYQEGEQELLEKELQTPNEAQRKYFWYNTPYTPKRSVLYQIFNIASGYIPPRLQIFSHLGEDGEIKYESYESTDDSWLLISHDED